MSGGNLQLSSLSNEMRALYHDLIGKVVVDLTVNNNVHIKIPLQNVDGIQEARNNLSLRPYQTLLLLLMKMYKRTSYLLWKNDPFLNHNKLIKLRNGRR